MLSWVHYGAQQSASSRFWSVNVKVLLYMFINVKIKNKHIYSYIDVYAVMRLINKSANRLKEAKYSTSLSNIKKRHIYFFVLRKGLHRGLSFRHCNHPNCGNPSCGQRKLDHILEKNSPTSRFQKFLKCTGEGMDNESPGMCWPI